jgi:hypothetical protein
MRDPATNNLEHMKEISAPGSESCPIHDNASGSANSGLPERGYELG